MAGARVRLDDLTSDGLDQMYEQLEQTRERNHYLEGYNTRETDRRKHWHARAVRAEQLLTEYVRLADVTHTYGAMGGHDRLGANFACAGCQLRDRARTVLDNGERAEQQLDHVRPDVSRAIWALRHPTPSGSDHYRAGWDAALDAAADAATTALDNGQQPSPACPGETDPRTCACPCDGCRHHCAAHHPGPECGASTSGHCLAMTHGDAPCDTEAGECVNGERPSADHATEQPGPAAEGSTPC